MRALLGQGKWRQARNDLKPLAKADRARFLPLLIEANVGLAREMLAHGQAAQARQVLEYLATIAPAERLRALELELAAKSDASAGQSPAQLIAALADPRCALPAEQRLRLADHVVLAFEPVSAEADPAQARLAAEARVIHEALQAVSGRAWAAVSDALRGVSHRSPFSHWVVFVKGLAAFHTGEAERATKLLQSLPVGSAPAKAAEAYLCLLDRGPAPLGAAAEAAAKAVSRLIGSAGVSTCLMRAERLWRSGRHVESYQALRDGVAPFPSAGLDWPGVLTEFYFKAPPGLLEGDRMAFLRLFAEVFTRGRAKNAAEVMFGHRLLALVGQVIAPTEELRADWETFLREHRALHGTNARLDSLAYTWLGRQLAATRPMRPFQAGRPPMRDAKGAVEMLRRSIQLDPANLGAHLSLCGVYDALKQPSERNRLLDEMTARFPDDKHVLIRAAEGCLERKAFGKGLDYLARARQLDQLDPRIPELTVAGLCAQARGQFQQRRPEKARQALAQAEAWLTDQPADFHRSRWTLWVRHGLMERRWGEAARAEALLAQARERAPNGAAMQLYAHLTERDHMGRQASDTPFLPMLKETLRKGAPPRLGEIVVLLRLLAHWRSGREDEAYVFREEEIVAAAIHRALGQPFTRAEATEAIECGCTNPEFAAPLKKLIKKLLQADPLDPQARLWRLEVREPWEFEVPMDRAELRSIVEEATRRRDEASLRKAQRILRELDQPNPFGPDFAGPEGDAEEDADDFEPDGPALPPEDLPPEMLEQFGDLIEAMRGAPESAIRDLRASAKRAGVPDFLIDTLIAVAKGKALPPLPPVPPGPPGPPPERATPRPVPPPNPAAPAPGQTYLF